MLTSCELVKCAWWRRQKQIFIFSGEQTHCLNDSYDWRAWFLLYFIFAVFYFISRTPLDLDQWTSTVCVPWIVIREKKSRNKIKNIPFLCFFFVKRQPKEASFPSPLHSPIVFFSFFRFVCLLFWILVDKKEELRCGKKPFKNAFRCCCCCYWSFVLCVLNLNKKSERLSGEINVCVFHFALRIVI